ncbi:MAG: 4Fe-4S dicluster domain-containing protein [Acidimicrobiia bacterium]|nr:4Fe-4S dicluster domain-containing protein [Acidimicrobiia bacterium]
MAPRELELTHLPQSADPPRGEPAALWDRLVEPFRGGDPPQPQLATGFYTDTTVCIGCKACEVACKQWNQLPADGFTWTGNSYDNTEELSGTSWRHVKFIEQFKPPPVGQAFQPDGAKSQAGKPDLRIALDLVPGAPQGNRWLMMSDVCKHCVTAPCQQACPTGAIVHNEFENVYIQADICNGCSYCIAACPFGVITRASFDGHSHKCTLCYDRQKDGLVPACAKACPTASIQFGPIDELRDRARQRVEELRRGGVTGAHLYGDTPSDTYSGLNSFYLLVDHPSVYGLPEKPFNPWLHMGGDYVRALVGGLAAILTLALVFLFLGH